MVVWDAFEVPQSKTYFSQGAFRHTDRKLDVALNGPGFSMVTSIWASLVPEAYLTSAPPKLLGEILSWCFKVRPEDTMLKPCFAFLFR